MMILPTLLAVAALLAAAPAARASTTPAVKGGQYRGSLTDGECPGCRTQALATVANDGLSLLAPSTIEYQALCGRAEPTTFPVAEAPRGVRIAKDGSFGWTGDSRDEIVEGRFSPDGQTVSGTVVVRRTAGNLGPTECASRFPFAARLTGRPRRTQPGRPSRCGEVNDFFDRHAVSVIERATGCTEAIDTADRWRRSRRCVQGPLSVRPCRINRFTCRPTRRGAFEAMATVTCRRGEAAVDLVLLYGCDYREEQDPGSIVLRAINVGCPAARRVTRAWERRNDCLLPDRTGQRCIAGGWRCVALDADEVGPAGFLLSQCRSPRNHRQAIQIALSYPPG